MKRFGYTFRGGMVLVVLAALLLLAGCGVEAGEMGKGFLDGIGCGGGVILVVLAAMWMWK